jgi:hypothetical protein
VPNEIIIAWDPGEEAIAATTADEVDVVLRRLDERFRREGGTPVLAMVEHAGETTSLGIGLGGAASMLSWLNNAEPEEDLVSEGPAGDTDSYAQFMYAGAESEYPASVLIGTEDALDAVRHYVTSGRRPPGIRWQSV